MMATARPTDIDDLFECPVCYDNYTDPRSLQCAHQFCLKCIERLVIKKPPAQDKITCPTCRQVTPIKPGEEARHLPRPVLMNELQSLLKTLAVSTTKSAPRYCNSCEAKDVPATKYCHQCHQKMCDSCLSDHERMPMFQGHNSVDITDYLFCKTHENLVTAFCHNCKCGICSGCAMKDHRKHKTEDIHVMASQSRAKVKGFFSTRKATTVSPTVSRQVKSKVCELEQSQKNIVSQINRVIDSLTALKSKLESTRNEVIAKTTADIKALKLYEVDLGDWRVSQTSLIEYGQYLLEKASEPELVLKAMELPTSPPTLKLVKAPSVNIPAGNNLQHLETELFKLKELCDLKYERSYIGEPAMSLPVRNLKAKFKQIIKISFYVGGAIFNPKLSQLSLRTNVRHSPIQIYTVGGTLVKGIGRGAEGLDKARGLSIDPTRVLYLAPCGDHLTTIDMQGKVQGVIQVPDSCLGGVTYCGTSDQYIVTDLQNNRVVIIDAKSRKVVSCFGSLGYGNNQFVRPYHVCVGDIRGRATIVVSDHGNHAVKLFDLRGRHVKTYGRYGEGDGQLDSPQGVAVDPAGRITVLDYKNQRVVSYWTDEEDKDHWECVLNVGLYGGFLALDHVHKLLAIRPNEETIKIYTYD